MFQYRHIYLTLWLTLYALFLGACTTTTSKEYAISGSNKNAGLVELSFDYSPRENVQVAVDQPTQLALQRCQMWGYTQANLLGNLENNCIKNEGSRCTLLRSTLKYQCQ